MSKGLEELNVSWLHHCTDEELKSIAEAITSDAHSYTVNGKTYGLNKKAVADACDARADRYQDLMMEFNDLNIALEVEEDEQPKGVFDGISRTTHPVWVIKAGSLAVDKLQEEIDKVDGMVVTHNNTLNTSIFDIKAYNDALKKAFKKDAFNTSTIFPSFGSIPTPAAPSQEAEQQEDEEVLKNRIYRALVGIIHKSFVCEEDRAKAIAKYMVNDKGE